MAEAIKDLMGDRWEDRVVVKTMHGPMKEVFHVPGKRDGAYETRDLYWWGEFGGEQYGAFVRVLVEEMDEVLEDDIAMLYRLACGTMDGVADDATGAIPGRTQRCFDMASADRELWQIVEPETHWLDCSEWRQGDLYLQRLDKFWQYRARRRKQLMEEFGLDWRTDGSNKSSGGDDD